MTAVSPTLLPSGPPVSQPSLFSADLQPPAVADLGGLLAAHGQLVRQPSTGTARVSILLDERWRADALSVEMRVRGLDPEALPAADGKILVRSAQTDGLAGLATRWIRGAVKALPPRPGLDAGFLRCWALAAGSRDDAGYRLGLDPHAPDTHDPLTAALAAAGLAGSFLGVRGGGPAVRIVGHKRLVRLADLLGSLPAGAPADAFPDPFPAVSTEAPSPRGNNRM